MQHSDGSRTLVLHDGQPREEELEHESPEDILANEGVLHLRGSRRTHPHVRWDDDVIDNEGMGKKKTKICCIFRKDKPFGESSSSDSNSSDSDADSDSDSDSGRAQPGGRMGQRRNFLHRSHPHPHDHDHDSECNGDGDGLAMQDTDESTVVQQLSDDEYEPNAYERPPGWKRGKGKRVDKDNAVFNPGD
ncbi:uncharacterized protein FOMMEDRAFT_76123 [Fomitiporia mediterranea MF3/22]|uniref:uncharacterized protein n=1 Tax=Fomitiporia mediterranea (strain MF3/22) TaxID=694068 RepID=UPI0004408647|nr:uncharacterized protein FOMMEDRAFT_76123 [Fomitiporia mediterranea MF3/22]EJD07028.1 hypothetical protein FOMMEDRAFT_76123 [Fomitiporia mediterranea MF3/22]